LLHLKKKIIEKRKNLYWKSIMQTDFKHIGNIAILQMHKTAFFCSRKAPPDIVLKTLDSAKEWREQSKTIISSFHSPVEKEVLHILLKGKQPIIICPARCVENMRIPQEWRQGIADGRILLLSPFDKTENRISSKHCERRNQFVAELANEIIIAHASKGGKIENLKSCYRNKIKKLGEREND
jgi:predicted Rossmann fold nucleotide-binding protein DprA/Smf involved in DNA uptake